MTQLLTQSSTVPPSTLASWSSFRLQSARYFNTILLPLNLSAGLLDQPGHLFPLLFSLELLGGYRADRHN